MVQPRIENVIEKPVDEGSGNSMMAPRSLDDAGDILEAVRRMTKKRTHNASLSSLNR